MGQTDTDTRSTAPAADLVHGSFTDHGPWLLDPDDLPWRRDAARLRARAQGDVPRLMAAKKLPPLGRMAVTAKDLGLPLALWALRERGTERSRPAISRRLRQAAERLGPTYVKLAQIISSGEGIFPAELVAEFRKCRDQVPAEPWISVRRVVEDELGKPIESVFRTFERTPLAAASIAQVHRATLQTGEEVVVKVQRPKVAKLVHRDLAVMAWIAPHMVGRIPIAALANPPALVELFAETIVEELDFRLEADNMVEIAKMFADLGQRGYVIARPHPRLVTKRLLVMERLQGFAFEDVAGMKAAGVDTHGVIRTGMVGFMEGALIHGIFHGDLHGGNLFVLADGRTALLDFGIVGRLTEPRRMAFLRLLMTATMNDVKGQLAALRDLGALPPDTDLDEVVRELGLDKPPIDPTQMSAEELVGELQRIMKALLGFGARIPKELMLFIKNMMFVDGAIATLAPDLDLLGEIAEVTTHFATEYGEQLAGQIGMDMGQWNLDMSGFKALYGVDDSTDAMTYRDLQDRRRKIAERFEAERPTAPARPRRRLPRRPKR